MDAEKLVLIADFLHNVQVAERWGDIDRALEMAGLMWNESDMSVEEILYLEQLAGIDWRSHELLSAMGKSLALGRLLAKNWVHVVDDTVCFKSNTLRLYVSHRYCLSLYIIDNFIEKESEA